MYLKIKDESMENPEIYIIIVNYNSWAHTIECLESILRDENSNYQIIIVDNDSTDNSVEYIKAWAEGKLCVWLRPDNPLRKNSFPPVKKPIPYIFFTSHEIENLEPEKILKNNCAILLVKSEQNSGFASGNNMAIKYLLKIEKHPEKKLVWILNPDVIVEKNAVKNILNFTNTLKESNFICGCVVKNYNNPEEILLLAGWKIHRFLGIVRPIKSIEKVNSIDYISGSSLITRLSSFKNLGLFPEEYFIYWEEADWCTKAKINGYKFLVCTDCVIYDKGGKSIGRKSETAVIHYLTNSFKYMTKYKNSIFDLIILTFFYLVRVLKRILGKELSLNRKVIKALLNPLGNRNGQKK